MSSRRLAIAVATIACGAGCTERASDAPLQEPAPPIEAVSPAVESPAPAVELAGGPTGAVEPAAPRNNPAVINFSGFGPARFGDDQESVRIAWGRPLTAGTPAAGTTCHYLTQDPPPPGVRGIAFMIEDGRFVRYDVDDSVHVAPGDIVIGDTAEKVIAAHPDRVEIQPHKYIEGATNFIVSPPDGGEGRLILEMSPVGRVVQWRIGVPPQVHYVERCG